MRKSQETTVIGHTNRNQQVNLGYDSPNGSDHNQKVYALRCDRVLPSGQKCGHIYGANGSDIHIRLCPKCQGGQPGLPLQKHYA